MTAEESTCGELIRQGTNGQHSMSRPKYESALVYNSTATLSVSRSLPAPE